MMTVDSVGIGLQTIGVLLPIMDFSEPWNALIVMKIRRCEPSGERGSSERSWRISPSSNSVGIWKRGMGGLTMKKRNSECTVIICSSSALMEPW